MAPLYMVEARCSVERETFTLCNDSLERWERKHQTPLESARDRSTSISEVKGAIG